MTVYASGGVSTVDRKIKDGDDCRNTWDLTGIVDGRIITSAGTANSDWSKSGSINFIIPAGATFSITSSPLPSYGCSPGSFSLVLTTDRRLIYRPVQHLTSCQSGVWKSAFSAQLYKCPLNRYTPPADWASYGCLGQISAVSTCSNVSYRNADVTLACTPIN